MWFLAALKIRKYQDLYVSYNFPFIDDVVKRFECDKIVGGRLARKGEFPWMVGIWRNARTTRPFCGGSLINDR